MTTRTVQTRWYRFVQNNSGGKFKRPAIRVHIEALDAMQANARAEDIGIYFDGANDCSCCGARWDRASEGEFGSSSEEPQYATAQDDEWGRRDGVPGAIRYALGDNSGVTMTTLAKTKTEP